MLELHERCASRKVAVTHQQGDALGPDSAVSVPVYERELWTSGQRQANPLHEISYRACFKPQLPAYFIERLTQEGDVVYDPFSGRGTTAVEAALRGRRVIANDTNPLSAILTINIGCQAHLQTATDLPVRHWTEARNDRLSG